MRPNELKLSANFTVNESILSATAIKLCIDNYPSMEVMAVLKKTAESMERVRTVLTNKPISVSSWYRCPELNAAIGSKSTSQHMKGEAVDFTCGSFGNPVRVCKALIEAKEYVQFDQLILEHNWIHISFAILSGKPRGQVLSLVKGGRFQSGLVDLHGTSY
jgi:zinc D-Ala-D-Ala carboxypeptidase